MDKDLRDDMLKLVKYRVLFVKREYETAFFEHEDVIEDNLDGGALTAWKVAEFAQKLEDRGERIPHKWGDVYPPKKHRGSYDSATKKFVQNDDGREFNGLPEEDKNICACPTTCSSAIRANASSTRNSRSRSSKRCATRCKDGGAHPDNLSKGLLFRQTVR